MGNGEEKMIMHIDDDAKIFDISNLRGLLGSL